MRKGIGKFELMITLVIAAWMVLLAFNSVQHELESDPNSIYYEQKTKEKTK